MTWSLNTFADSKDYQREAQVYLEKGEIDAAVIQLKNALLADPENGQARLLLGKTYLEQKNGASAVKELRRARELGVAREAVLLPLGRAMLMTGQHEQLLETITPEDSDPVTLQDEILLLQAEAYLAIGQLELASERFSAVLQRQPEASKALLGQARIALLKRDTTDAINRVNQALASAPEYTEAWILKGELLRGTGQPQEALAAFQRAVELDPGNVLAHVGRATLHLALTETEQAKADLDWLLKNYPDLYLTHYLRALQLYQQQQTGPAQESVKLALRQAPRHLPSHLLAGTIAYQREELNQAERHLRIYWNDAPQKTQTAKLLAATLMKLKRPGDAIQILEPGVASASNDVQYLSLLGSAYLSQGDTASGVEYLEQAAALAPDMASIRTQLAIGQLSLGEVEQGISELHTAVELDQDLLQADVLLVMVHLQRQEFEQALSAIDTLAAKMPHDPLPLNLKGAALAGKGDRAAARRAFGAALTLQPDHLPALLNLAQLELLEGNPEAAEKRYLEAVSHDEGNLKALLALAGLAERAGQETIKLQWLKQAHLQNPEAIQPALQLLQHYQHHKDLNRALHMAESIAVKYPREPEVQNALAQVQLQAGRNKEALMTLNKLVEIVPQSPEAHYVRGAVQVKLKKTGAARTTLQQAVELRPDYPAAQLMLGRLEISYKNHGAAREIAAALLKAHPDAAFGDELNGDAYRARGAYQQAEQSYAQAYGKQSSAPLARKLFHSRANLGQIEAGQNTLRQWLAEQPDDVVTRSLLAQSLIKTGNLSQAIDEYLIVIKYEPSNVSALNNVAWLHQEQGDYPAGVKYAERAHQLAPGRPEITDTLGWLLVQNGDTNRGLVLLQEARIKAPNIPEIHYHMAVALHHAGRNDEARRELNRLLQSGKPFSNIEDARALHNQLGG